MKRGLVMVAFVAIMLMPATGVAHGARTKPVGGFGYGCNFGSLIVSVGWERKGGRVTSLRWTRYVQNGSSLDFDRQDTNTPDDAFGGHITWTNMPEGYYSFRVDLLDAKGGVLATTDNRPTTQYCYPWP
jgi:hypothetical protein